MAPPGNCCVPFDASENAITLLLCAVLQEVLQGKVPKGVAAQCGGLLEKCFTECDHLPRTAQPQQVLHDAAAVPVLRRLHHQSLTPQQLVDDELRCLWTVQ